MVIGAYILIISINKNGLNTLTKRHRLAEWVQKKGHLYILSKRDPLQTYGHIQTESEGMEKRYSMQMDIKRKLM